MAVKVGLTYNLRRQQLIDRPSTGKDELPEDFFIEFDEEGTVDAIADALRKGGCRVTKIEANEKSYDKIRRVKPDIVFNIAEGSRGESRESHIPAILEMLGLPYTGSGPLALALSLDKALTHQILYANNIPSPSYQVFTKTDEKKNRKLEFPLVVKPLWEGSSKGIRNNSLVRDDESLRRQLAWVIETYDQPAIVEKFLSGREFTVGLIGNDELLILPIVEIMLGKLPKEAVPLYSFEAKWVWDTPEKPLEIFSCPAQIPLELEKKMRRIAAKTFKVLRCRDLCRIDMRLDENNEPFVLEVNPLPGLIPDPKAHSCLPEAASVAGLKFDQLICMILWQAIKRYGLDRIFKDQLPAINRKIMRKLGDPLA